MRCPQCNNHILSLCDHEPGCLELQLATQETEPLPSDALRIVELERRVRELERHVVKTKPVLLAALELGRRWAKGSTSMTSDDYANLHHLNVLAAAVQVFDALQPKG